ncbi:MAG: hypothetical protein ACTSUE_26425 [Promethearchaeota archaeon]
MEDKETPTEQRTLTRYDLVMSPSSSRFPRTQSTMVRPSGRNTYGHIRTKSQVFTRPSKDSSPFWEGHIKKKEPKDNLCESKELILSTEEEELILSTEEEEEEMIHCDNGLNISLSSSPSKKINGCHNETLSTVNKVALDDRLSKYLTGISYVDPGDRNQHIRKTPRAYSSTGSNTRARIKYYDGMSAFLYTPGDPDVLWFCHEDKKMHRGIKHSEIYVSFLQVIATHDKEKEIWGESYEHEENFDDDDDDNLSTSRKKFGRSLPCTPRRSSNSGNGTTRIPRNQSANHLPSLFSSMEEELKDEAIRNLPNIYISWYGIVNGKAITTCMFDRETNRMTLNVGAYAENKSNLGMHSKVPVHLPSFYFAQEGGYRVIHPGQAGRECSVFMETPLSDREWKREFDRHDEVYVKSERLYCIDEAYIDMDHQLDPLKSIMRR